MVSKQSGGTFSPFSSIRQVILIGFLDSNRALLDSSVQESWEDISQPVMEESVNIENRQVVEVLPVACITRESWWTNSKSKYIGVFLILVFINSHQGYFGKKGIRVFHLQRNWQWAPTVNTDSLWGLLPDGM